jgi:DNA polymerase-4
MPTAEALRRCPGLLVVSGRHGYYSELSDQVMAIFHQTTALVEQLSIDEAFLDLSDLPQTPLELAKSLQSEVDRQTRLPCSIGAASNKLVAKTATDVGKAAHRGITPPRAILVVPVGEEAAFMAPLPVKMLYGIGPKTAERLQQIGVHTIGELAQLPAAQLEFEFGKFGAEMALRARGVDEREVSLQHEMKSISQEVTFERDVLDESVMRRKLLDLSEKVGYRLRQAGMCGHTVRIKLRWPDFSTPTRQMRLTLPTDQDAVIYEAVLKLFGGLWQPGKAVRLLGVGVSGLAEPARQLSLWDTTNERERRLLDALDDLRQRFGEAAVQRASKIKPKTAK